MNQLGFLSVCRSVINLQRPKTDALSKGFINLSLRGGRGPLAPGDPCCVSTGTAEVERPAGTQTPRHFGFMGIFQSKCEAMTSWHHFFSYYQPGVLVKRKWIIFNSLIPQVSLFYIFADEFCLAFGLFLTFDRLNKALVRTFCSADEGRRAVSAQQKSKRPRHFMAHPAKTKPCSSCFVSLMFESCFSHHQHAAGRPRGDVDSEGVHVCATEREEQTDCKAGLQSAGLVCMCVIS